VERALGEAESVGKILGVVDYDARSLGTYLTKTRDFLDQREAGLFKSIMRHGLDGEV
jgi:hypothetical protein